MEVVNDIKEKMCMVAQDYFLDAKGESKFSEEECLYELPDGTVITINN